MLTVPAPGTGVVVPAPELLLPPVSNEAATGEEQVTTRPSPELAACCMLCIKLRGRGRLSGSMLPHASLTFLWAVRFSKRRFAACS